jgi:hypothetical protein
MKTFKNCTCYFSNHDGSSGENEGVVSFDETKIRITIAALDEDWSGIQDSPGHFKLWQKSNDWADLHMFPGEPGTSGCTSLVGKYRMIAGPDISLSKNVVES